METIRHIRNRAIPAAPAALAPRLSNSMPTTVTTTLWVNRAARAGMVETPRYTTDRIVPTTVPYTNTCVLVKETKLLRKGKHILSELVWVLCKDFSRHHVTVQCSGLQHWTVRCFISIFHRFPQCWSKTAGVIHQLFQEFLGSE